MNTAAIIVLLLGAVYWIFRPRDTRARAPRLMRRSPRPFPATSIVHQQDACGAVKALDGHRFLAWEAPDLPLPGCGSAGCQCRYVYHKDRRAPGSDRRRPDTNHRVEAGFDRRRTGDRRQSTETVTGKTRPVDSESLAG